MKRTTLPLIVIALLLVGHVQASTTFIYVAITGNDTTGDGSPNKPYKTPDRARQAVAALGTCASRSGPAVVYFGSGIYPLSTTWTFTSSDSGCSANPVTYTANPSDLTTPVISGGVVLNSANGYTWTNVSGSLWKVTLPSALSGYSPEALYYNGTRRFRPRPGAVSGSGLPGLVGAYYRVAATISTCGGGTSPCYDRFQYTAGDPPDSKSTWTNYAAWNTNSNCTNSGNANYNGDIEILIFENWTMSRERIACVDTTNKIVYLAGNTVQNSSHGYIVGHRYIIENVSTGTSNLIAGQFYIDRNTTPFTLYYMAQTGETPSSASVIIPVLQPSGTAGAVLSATSLQYVTFSNLKFSHDNYAPPTAGFGAAQSNTNLPAAVTCMNCSNTTWTGNYFTQTTGNALWLETNSSGTPTSNSITYNNFYDLGSDGLVYGDLPASGDTNSNILNSGTITENLVQGYGRLYAGASGIEHPFGRTTDIENNDVTDGYNTGIGICVPNINRNCGGTGTSGGVANNITGNFNHVWNIGKGVTDDMGAFYIATYAATGNVVKNNRLHDVQDAETYDTDGYGGNGIYIDNTTGNITAQNNLVYRVTGHAVQNTQGPPDCGEPNTVQNNILSLARVAMFYAGEEQQPFQIDTCLTETLQNNIFYFDRTDTSTCGIGLNTNKCKFFVQAACSVLDSAPTQAQIYVANLYYNTGLSTWGTTYTKAMYTDLNSDCTGAKYYKFPDWQALGQDTGSAVFSPGFTNPACTYSTAVQCQAHSTQDDYSIPGIAPGQTLTISPGNYFTAFSMTAPGRQSPTFTPPAILDTFPTKMFDTTTTNGNF